MVHARLERFAASKDPAVVLDSEALAEVGALLGNEPDGRLDFDSALAVGLLHWIRYLVLPSGEDKQDQAAALLLLRPVYEVLPDAVPADLRRYLDADESDDVAGPAAAAGRAVLLMRNAFADGE